MLEEHIQIKASATIYVSKSIIDPTSDAHLKILKEPAINRSQASTIPIKYTSAPAALTLST